MACGVTLKRSRELDPLMSPDSSIKRRRTSVNAGHCSPYRPSFSHSSPHQHQNSSGLSAAASAATPSSFETAGPKISPDELESYLLSEIRSLRKRAMLPGRQEGDGFFGGRYSPASGGANSDSDSEHRMDSAPGGHCSTFGDYNQAAAQLHEHRSSMQASSALAQSDRPLFTYKQVRLVCERLLKEQESRLREEYENILNTKLSEQYDTFVRFTYDQIHRRLDEAPMTYLS